MRRNSILYVATLSILALFGCAQQPPTTTVQSSQPATETTPTPEATTIKNLQTVYNGESNAHVLYLAFAKKADEEGYKGVASLFRSAARAEEIHKENHAKVIQEMGGKPEAKIATPQVKSTAENLAAAMKGESYERDTMYPEFINQAKATGNQDAVQTFTYAADAEAEHAKLYNEALKNLDNWKQAKTFYVCSASGNTSMKASNAANCPPSNGKETFEKVS